MDVEVCFKRVIFAPYFQPASVPTPVLSVRVNEVLGPVYHGFIGPFLLEV